MCLSVSRCMSSTSKSHSVVSLTSRRSRRSAFNSHKSCSSWRKRLPRSVQNLHRILVKVHSRNFRTVGL